MGIDLLFVIFPYVVFLSFQICDTVSFLLLCCSVKSSKNFSFSLSKIVLLVFIKHFQDLNSLKYFNRDEKMFHFEERPKRSTETSNKQQINREET